MPQNPALSEFVDHLIKTRYRTAHALASAIAMTESAFSRAVRTEGTLADGNCIKLARLTGELPSTVLQKAGRPQDVIDAAVRLEGKTLSGREKELLKLWRGADPKVQAAQLVILNAAKVILAKGKNT